MNSHNKLKLIFVIGILAIGGTPFLFHLPVFGMGTLVAIFALFVYFQWINLKLLRRSEAEMLFIEKIDVSAPSKEDLKSLIGERIVKIHKAKQIHLTLKMSDFLLPSVIREKESGANLAVILGLVGTFFGLLSVVGNAGSMYSEHTDLGQLSLLLPNIFKNMQGLFGSSFAGLIASLALTLSHNILMSVWDEVEEKLDHKTQFELLPQIGEQHQEAQKEDLLVLIDEVKLLRKDMQNQWGEQLSQVTAVAQTQNEQFQQESLKIFKNTQQEFMEKWQIWNEEIQKSQREVSQIQKEQWNADRDVLKESLSHFSQELTQVSRAAKDQTDAQLSSILSSFERIPQENHKILNQFAQDLVNQVQKVQESLAQSPQIIIESLNTQTQILERQHQEHSSSLRVLHHEAQKQWLGFADSIQSDFQKVSESFAAFGQEGLEQFKNDAQNLIRSSADVLSIGAEKTQDAISKVLNLESVLAGVMGLVEESVNAMKVQQVEFQASLEMFQVGVEGLLEELSAKSNDTQALEKIIQQLEKSNATIIHQTQEVLDQNNLELREILMLTLNELRSGVRS